MMIPIRCITCGTPIAGKWEKFTDKVSKKENPKLVLDELKITRYCCRNMFITHIDLIDDIAQFKINKA
ncbi:MAG: DNA-directed RNA polymerase subunit N [DPANN group archaeon]|nr:DNA-directed RNA polymerase subunit N [DPANN group archaeon]